MKQEKLKILQTSIQGRYARALFEVAAEQNQVDTILSGLKYFAYAIEDANLQPGTLGYMQKGAFQSLMQTCVERLAWPLYLSHFFELLYQAKRLNLLNQVIKIFELLKDEKQDRLKAHIAFAKIPSTTTKEKIEKKISMLFGKEMRYEYQAIPSLLNGFVATINDSLQIDTSLATQLNHLNHSFKET